MGAARTISILKVQEHAAVIRLTAVEVIDSLSENAMDAAKAAAVKFGEKHVSDIAGFANDVRSTYEVLERLHQAALA